MKAVSPPSAGVSPAFPRLDQGLGERIRFSRQQRGMSLDQLGAVAGLSKSYLSKVERQLVVPSIITALKISSALGQTVGQLLGESLDEFALCIVHKNERQRLLQNDTDTGYDIMTMASKRLHKKMEVLIIRPPHKFHSEKKFARTGEGFIFVLSGQIEIEFIDRSVLLESGDALYFDSHNPHGSRSVGTKRAEALVVVLGNS